MKRSRLILLFFVVACILVLASAGAALAATSNSALWCPNVAPESTAQLGTLRILESPAGGSIKPGDWVSISLPSYAEVQKLTVVTPTSSTLIPSVNVNIVVSDSGFSFSTAPDTVYAFGEEAPLKVNELYVSVVNRNTLNFTVKKSWSPLASTLTMLVLWDEIKIKPVTPEDLESSDIKATLDAPSTAGFSSGSVTVGKLLTAGGSTITAASAAGITGIGGGIADITLKEDVAGALKVNKDVFPGGDTVKLVLSPGFTWDTVTLIPQGGFASGSVDKAVHTEKNGCSALYLKINTATTSQPGQLVIKASVKANEPFTTARDVKVTYGGTNPGVGGERIAEVTVAKYLVSGLSVAARSTLDAVAGRLNQQIGNFTVAEGMPGNLRRDSFISLTLPEGAKWNRLPTIGREAGDGQLRYHSTYDKGRTVLYSVFQASTSRTIFCFKNATVDLAVYAPEELSVTLKGPGIEDTVTVAQVQAPVAISAADGTVRIGAQEQAAGAVTIQENLVGALRARDAAGNRAVLKLTLPSGVYFARKPAVAVTAGDLKLYTDGVRLEDNDRTLAIPVELSSATAVEKPASAGTDSASETDAGTVSEQVGSTVTIKDIFLTLDRRVAEGSITVKVSGSALSETMDLFTSSLNELVLVLANCTEKTIRPEAVFTVGSKKYRVGNEEREMDVAPYIK
ncbi:MAG: copper amine oxidase N-terminal domain-containing protein, partial [Clostridia bacterium]|nr:copper amine oxidase N-terminal domain-containing protein [Clostridia bacterium]